jgi:hypothetical protein
MSSDQADRLLHALEAIGETALGTALGCAALIDWAVTGRRRRAAAAASVGVALAVHGLRRL